MSFYMFTFKMVAKYHLVDTLDKNPK